MPRLWSCVGLIMISGVSAEAQQSPLAVSVDYANLRIHQDGWESSVSKNLWRGLGAEADVSDYFYGGVSSLYSNGFSFLFGPRFSVTPGTLGSGRITLFGHALVGGVRGRQFACNYITLTINGVTTRCTQFNYKTAFETALGGGADVRISTHFAVRLAHFDYVQAYYPQEHQRYLRFSTGGVLLLGAVSPVPPLHLPAQTGNQYRGQGYLFFAPGATSPATVHIGGGGEGFIYRGLGLGAEVGYGGEWGNFRSNGVGIGSADLSYHFAPRAQHPKVEPFVTAGYTLFFRHGTASGVNLGGGVNIWLKEHAALRLEIRDNANGMGTHTPAGAQHFVAFRTGITFR